MRLSPLIPFSFRGRSRPCRAPLISLVLSLSFPATALVSAQDGMLAFESLFTSSPPNWRSEILPFPLEFAPDIELRGREELRFSPGMFKPKKKDFFTYTFIWWLDGKVPVNQEMLQDNLLRYFRGLYQAGGKKNDQDYSSIKVEVTTTREPAWVPGAEQNFRARIDWVDSFITQKPLILQIMISEWYCQNLGHTAVFFAVSPNQEAQNLWDTMKGMRAGQCE